MFPIWLEAGGLKLSSKLNFSQCTPSPITTNSRPKAQATLLSVSTASGSDRIIESWSKPLSVLARCDERLYHLGSHEVAVELIQLCQPEIITGIVCVWPGVRIAAEVTEILD